MLKSICYSVSVVMFGFVLCYLVTGCAKKEVPQVCDADFCATSKEELFYLRSSDYKPYNK